jgi:uncharacterized spore protein YtfJ
MDHEQAVAEAREAGGTAAADRLLERLAEFIGAKASVQAVFGEPVHHDGLTVIPVARVRWGFGGGGGRSDAAPSGPSFGSGGGGGVAADAIGYLEVRSKGATFHPIRGPYPSPAFVIACGLTAAIVIRAITRLIRGSVR